MAKNGETPLESVPGFPPSSATQLATLWITTAEELMTRGGPGKRPVRAWRLLGLAADDVAPLVAAAEAVVPLGLPYAEEDIALALGAVVVEGASSPEAEPLA